MQRRAARVLFGNKKKETRRDILVTEGMCWIRRNEALLPPFRTVRPTRSSLPLYMNGKKKENVDLGGYRSSLIITPQPIPTRLLLTAQAAGGYEAVRGAHR
jgi:hypothetical protein